jgi:membrane protein DedA with SNARE-associated domain
MNFDALQPIFDWIAAHPALAGWVVYIVATLESLAIIGIIVPGVLFMLGIGTLVGLGALSLWQTLIWTVLGAITGDGVSYWLGRRYDKQIAGLWPLRNYPDLMPKGERFFIKYGGISVLFGRFIGPIRPIIPAVAGMMHMPVVRFYTVNVVSAAAWAPVVIFPGVLFAHSLKLASNMSVRFIILLVLLSAVLAVCVWAAHKIYVRVLVPAVTMMYPKTASYSVKTKWGVRTLVFILVGAVMVSLLSKSELPRSLNIAFDEISWWQSGQWKQVSIFQKPSRSGYNINVQWLASATQIRNSLQQLHAGVLPKLTLKTALYWLLPELDNEQIPVPEIILLGRYPDYSVVMPLGAKDTLLLLRLWRARIDTDADARQLWLGNCAVIKMLRFPGLAVLPKVQDAEGTSINILKHQLLSLNQQLQLKTVTINAPLLDMNWDGVVLLGNSAAAPG